MSLQADSTRIRFTSGHGGSLSFLRILLCLVFLVSCWGVMGAAAEDASSGERPAGGSEAPRPCVLHADCSDGNACNGLEICQGGVCIAGEKLQCRSGNPCVFSICDPRSGCRERPLNSGPCDDGNPCTTGDACQAGKCVAEGRLVCRDQGPCMIGVCDPDSGCGTKPARDGSVCDDGREDTRNDRCQAGRCRGDGIDPLILEQMEDDKLFDLQMDPDREHG